MSTSMRAKIAFLTVLPLIQNAMTYAQVPNREDKIPPELQQAINEVVEIQAVRQLATPSRPTGGAAWQLRTEIPTEQRKTNYLLSQGGKLYQQHCVNCHGPHGSGDGVEANRMNVKPRDFRRGIFKWHSGNTGEKPSRHDIFETIRLGIQDAGMPTFAILPSEDRVALVEYVRYLAIRGEFVHTMSNMLADEILEEDELRDPDLVAEMAEHAQEKVTTSWKKANKIETRVIPKSEFPNMTAESIERGRQLYMGKFSCFHCHGEDGKKTKMNGQDAWGRQAIMPDLTKGRYRGGAGPVDLYQRMMAGIWGTPHPTMRFVLPDEGEKPIWDVVHYTYHLANLKPVTDSKLARLPHPKKDDVSTFDDLTPTNEIDDPATPEFRPLAWGSIAGRILYEGAAPVSLELPVTGDRAVLNGKKIFDESLLIDSVDQGIANCVVIIKRQQQGIQLPKPRSENDNVGKALLMSEGLRFNPRVLVMRPGEMTVENKDSVASNFRIAPSRNPTINQLLPSKAKTTYDFKHEEPQPVLVTSALHPWMKSYLIITSNPFVALTDSEGMFRLPELPIGVWEATIWHERMGSLDSAKVRGDFQFEEGKLLIHVSAKNSTTGTVIITAQQFQQQK